MGDVPSVADVNFHQLGTGVLERDSPVGCCAGAVEHECEPDSVGPEEA